MRLAPVLGPWLVLSLAACTKTVDSDSCGCEDVTDLDGDGYAEDDGDCDDTDPTVGPGAGETYYDGVDNDCDPTTVDDDQDADGAVVTDDCNDYDAAIHDGADEVCDDADNDCDGLADEVDGVPGYVDMDGDGYGDPAHPPSVCDPFETVIVDDGTDCDDTNADVHPGGVEVCDGLDNDCSTVVDDNVPDAPAWHADSDVDGFGDPAVVSNSCEPPAGSVADATDCDDAASATYPGAPEVDDGVDQDCDSAVDEDFVAAGDVVITEVALLPYVGGAAVVPDAQWFEVQNVSDRELDLSEWLVARGDGSAGFYVDPGAGLVLGAGERAVLCSTEAYVGAADVAYPLGCDYTWGDPAEDDSYAGTYHSNVFDLAAGGDALALYVGGGSDVLADSVAWTYTGGVDGDWPHDASRTLSLDPGLVDAAANDAVGSWCSAPADATWWTDGAAYEYGSPGGENGGCPT